MTDTEKCTVLLDNMPRNSWCMNMRVKPYHHLVFPMEGQGRRWKQFFSLLVHHHGKEECLQKIEAKSTIINKQDWT